MRYLSPDHTNDVYGNRFPQLVRDLVATATNIRRWFPYEVLVGCGNSGAVVPVMAYLMGLDFALVRKLTDTINHDWHHINGRVDAPYLIVDDLVGSGRTLANIISEVERAHRNYHELDSPKGDPDLLGPQPVGVFLYSADWGHSYRIHWNAKAPEAVLEIPVFLLRPRNESCSGPRVLTPYPQLRDPTTLRGTAATLQRFTPAHLSLTPSPDSETMTS